MKYCEELRKEMLTIEIKTIKKTSTSAAYDFSRPLTLHHQLIKKEDTLMAGLEKLGEHSIFCPYGIFEKVLSQGLLQHKKASIFADKETVPFKKGCCEGYLAVINYYNNHSNQIYCQLVIQPKVTKVEGRYNNLLKKIKDL